MKRTITIVLGLVTVVAAAIAAGAAVQQATSSPPCVKPTSLMFFSEAVPAAQQIEAAAKDAIVGGGLYKPGVAFNVEMSPLRQEPTIISGAIVAGNGQAQTIFGNFYLGGDVVYGFTATRKCDGGGWSFKLGKRFAKDKPAFGYRSDGTPIPVKRGGRPANPDK